MLSDCNERCATFKNTIHVCYDKIQTDDRSGPLYKGFFGTATLATIKIIRICVENREFFREIIFQHRSEYLVQYFRIEETERLRLVAMERIDSNLKDLEYKMISKGQRLEFIKNICHGIDILHNKFHIVHRDINPSNIMLKKNPNNTYTAKLADSGISKKISDNNCAPFTPYGTREFFFLFKIKPS